MNDAMSEAMSNLWADTKRKPTITLKPRVVQKQRPRIVYVQRPKLKKAIKRKSVSYSSDPYIGSINKQRALLEAKRRLAEERKRYEPYKRKPIQEIRQGSQAIGKGIAVTYKTASAGINKVVDKFAGKPRAINEYSGSIYKRSLLDKIRGKKKYD